MSDRDETGAAWRLAPSSYAAGREVEFALPEAPASRYLTMRDGCRIAVDVWLPQGVTDRVPAILILTPYYRRLAPIPTPPASSRRRRMLRAPAPCWPRPGCRMASA